MKTLLKFLAVLTVLALSSAPSLLRAQDDSSSDDQGVSFQNFYDQLGDQGTWVQTDDYGYVFQPNVSDPNWAPYTDGHWVDTDEGWTWVSDEPWGWATYHYGRWANIDGSGWVWIPGYRWAPAWVSWRYGGGYCGWAPLPPETFVGAEYGEPGVDVGIGFHFGGDVDVNFNIGPGCYNFVRIDDMGERNYRGRYIDRSRNFTVINNTTNITNINVNRGGRGAGNNFRGVAAGGPPINEVNAHSRQHIQTVQLTQSNQPGRSNLQGNSLAVYAPQVNPASARQARPARVGQTIAHPNFNRGDSITKPLDVTSTVKATAPSAAAIQEAQTAQLHAPSKARIATEKTTMKTPMNKPLTSLEPVTHRTPNVATPGGGVNGGGANNTVNPNTERGGGGANAQFTGESVKPSVTQPGEVKPKQEKKQKTFQPQNGGQPQNEVKPAQTFHPQNEAQPKNEVKPAQTFHPQNEAQPQNEVKPAQTFHPQNEAQPQREAKAPPTHTQQATHAERPAGGQGGQGGNKKPSGGGGEKKKAPDDKGKPQGQ